MSTPITKIIFHIGQRPPVEWDMRPLYLQSLTQLIRLYMGVRILDYYRTHCLGPRGKQHAFQLLQRVNNIVK